MGPKSGNFYAVSTWNQPGAHVIAQNIFVDAGVTLVTLSFDMFANNFSRQMVIGSNLSAVMGGPANQHAQVDLLDLEQICSRQLKLTSLEIYSLALMTDQIQTLIQHIHLVYPRT